MKDILNGLINYINDKDRKAQSDKDITCALRLSYNNFDEKLKPGKRDYYTECKK